MIDAGSSRSIIGLTEEHAKEMGRESRLVRVIYHGLCLSWGNPPLMLGYN